MASLDISMKMKIESGNNMDRERVIRLYSWKNVNIFIEVTKSRRTCMLVNTGLINEIIWRYEVPLSSGIDGETKVTSMTSSSSHQVECRCGELQKSLLFTTSFCLFINNSIEIRFIRKKGIITRQIKRSRELLDVIGIKQFRRIRVIIFFW